MLFSVKSVSYLLPPANEVWGKVMFLHLCVILFTGGSAQPPRCLPPAVGQTPRDADPTPRMQTPKVGQTPWMHTPSRMQIPCGWADPRGGRPPRCRPPGLGRPPPIQSTSGRYAFYSNAYLFKLNLLYINFDSKILAC